MAKNFNDYTPEQRAEMGRLGGIKSGETKRRKKETKDIKLSIRVTKTEKEILQQKADALGITLSKYMLNCALGRESHERN